MKICLKLFVCIILCALLFTFGTLLADKVHLKSQVILLEITPGFKCICHQAICNSIHNHIAQKMLESADSQTRVTEYLTKNLNDINQAVTDALLNEGCTEQIAITVIQRPVSSTVIDGFYIPSGKYYTIEICIGDGIGTSHQSILHPIAITHAGNNPFTNIKLLPVFENTQDNYIFNFSETSIRFKLLDFLGKIENFTIN